MHSRKWRCISHLHCGTENLQTSKSYTGWRKPSHRYVCNTYDLIIDMFNYQNNSIYNLRPEWNLLSQYTSKKSEMRRDIKTKAKTCVWLYSVGLFWGCWHTLWPLANWLCIEKNFWLMYKCISDSNQPRMQEEDILTPLKSYNVNLTLNSPNCIYDLTKSLGGHRIYNFPFHTKDTLNTGMI